VVGEEWNPQILVNWPVTNLPRCVVSSAKALGLKHLQLSDMAADSESPDRACINHKGKEELLVEQHIVPEEETASPV
jgi:hypothetical protein